MLHCYKSSSLLETGHQTICPGLATFGVSESVCTFYILLNHSFKSVWTAGVEAVVSVWFKLETKMHKGCPGVSINTCPLISSQKPDLHSECDL